MTHSFSLQVHELPPEKLRMREVEYIDIGNDPFPPKVNKYSICCYLLYYFYFILSVYIYNIDIYHYCLLLMLLL